MDKVTYKTTRSELAKVAMPEQTSHYKPISHDQLIDLTLNSIQNAGFELEKEWYESAREGQIATGHYAIKNIADDEMQLQIAWQNSMNKQVSLKFALGVHVFVCSNGACSSDMGNFKRKHTGDVQEFTPKTIGDYIHTAGEAFSQMQKQRDAMKEMQLSKRIQAELLGRMFVEEDFLESTQANIIRRELMKATNDYGAPNSMWELYQFTTFAMRDVHPSLWMKNHLAANKFFVNEAGVFVPSKSIIIGKTEDVAENQMEIYDVPGVVETLTSTERDPEDVENIPMASKDCFKPIETVIAEVEETISESANEAFSTPSQTEEIVVESEPLVIPHEDELDVPAEAPEKEENNTTSNTTTEYSDLM